MSSTSGVSAAKRARALRDVEVGFSQYVFGGTEFPKCVFGRPRSAKRLIGPCTIKAVFYDKEHKQVTTADSPGRYGAVIEISPEKGRVIRRYRTLFRAPGAGPWGGGPVPRGKGRRWGVSTEIVIKSLPDGLGIDPRVLASQSRVVSDYAKSKLFADFWRSSAGAVLLAGLYETKSSAAAASRSDDVYAMNRQWWVDQKRMMTGFDKLYPKPFVCPRPIKGPPATVLRKGTAAQADVKKDAVGRIDKVCKAWAADSDQAFAVCLARHGVVFFHKAYGQRDGKPMTLKTKSWMASITKAMSGSLMMMLVDQGLVDLNTPVDKYVPALRGIKVKTPLTIRHLYTHTNGFVGHWGDNMNDLGEVIADFYPYLKVGDHHEYNGVGYALGGKIIETISGEALPHFYQKHLLGPLGNSDTSVAGTFGDAQSTPMNIARLGQLFLNRGAYGKMRFFSEKTFKQMQPRKLTALLGPKTKRYWGIGLGRFEQEGLSEQTFGHGAASSAIFMVDPVNDLIVVMTRNNAGSNYDKYREQFIAAVADVLP